MKPAKKRRHPLCLLLCAAVIYVLANAAAICLYARADETVPCDAGIVLGAAAYDSGVSEVYRQRLAHAITLYRDGTVKKIIVTGGQPEGNAHSDAFTAGQYLESQGIAHEAILLEETSTITQENLENAKILMDENGLESALIVSDPLHMKRAMLLARDAGIPAFSSPTETSAYQSLKTKLPFAARETFFYIGYKWYRIFF